MTSIHTNTGPTQKILGQSTSDDIIQKLLITRNVARQNNEDSTDQAHLQFDAKAAPHKFLPNQLILLDEHSFLGKNKKLAPEVVWTKQNFLTKRRCKFRDST